MKKNESYKGKLTDAQIAQGMNAAENNACRLVEDAKILLAAERFPTAASIATLAIEEAGKVSILRELALAKSDAELIQSWKDYRSHTKKNAMWIFPELVAKGARIIDDFRSAFDENSDHSAILDQVKQLGFYSDCLGKAHWAIPSDTIDEELAKGLVEIAQLLSKSHEHTEKEIELWREHVGPVWKSNYSWMKQAVVNWSKAMHEAGLAPDIADGMEQFLHDGIQQ
jgi:AbiV family abortive infection protein